MYFYWDSITAMILLSPLIGVKSFNYFATLCRTAVSKVVKEQIINFLIVDFLFKI